MGKGREVGKIIANKFFFKQKYNPCWTSCWKSGGDTVIPHTFSLTSDHSLISRRSGWTWTSNLWNHEAALLPLSHRSLVWTCAGTYISLLIWSFYKKPVKFWTHWAGIWTHDTTTILIVSNVCLVISATLAFTLRAGIWATLLNVMQYMSFNVSNSGARTQDATIPTQHSASWATEPDELMIVLDGFYWERWFMWLKKIKIRVF